MKIHSMWDQYPLLQAELVATNELLEKNITLKNQAVREAILVAAAFGRENAAAGLLPVVFLLFPATGCGTGAGDRGCGGVVAYGDVDAR